MKHSSPLLERLAPVAENAEMRARLYEQKRRKTLFKLKSLGGIALGVCALSLGSFFLQSSPPCPEGAQLVGAQPPLDVVEYCATFEEGEPVRNGKFTEYYRDRGYWEDGDKVATKRLQGVYRDDFENGTFRKWDFKGRLQYEKTYRDGVLQGPYTLYEEGHLKTRGSYKQGLKHGPHEELTPTGQISRSGMYLHGKRDGEWTYLWGDGRVRKRHQYKNGADHGEISEWFPEGGLKSLSFFDNGHPVGQWIAFRRDSSLKSSQNFLFGAAHGPWRLYGEKGQLLSEKIYAAGVLEGPARRFHPDGEPAVTGFFVKGLKHGVWRDFDRAGDLVREIEYRAGVEVASTQVL